MAQIIIKIPGFGDHDGETPIVILGPNGSGKTRLAQKVAQINQVSAISAQRRTWLSDSLPVQEEQLLRTNMRSRIDQWRNNSWQSTEEIDLVLSILVQDHTNILTKKNEEAIDSGKPFDPVTDTKLVLLQNLWSRLFPKRKLEIGGFFPRVKRLDADAAEAAYHLRQMSDGERTVLYMAARVLTADQSVILVDEPELHMHCRLSVQFWDEAEKLRPDCRFVYLTHDLNFSLSRRSAAFLIARTNDKAEAILTDQLPSSVAAEVLGAATLPFYAKRIFLFEGESGKGFASEFFSVWFNGYETFAIPVGNRDSVIAAVTGLKRVGVVAAEIIGLIDRDYNSDAFLEAVPDNVTVLRLHEIESVLCDQDVIASLATHLGKDSCAVQEDFLARVRKDFRGQTLNAVIARRVRSRINELLDGAFSGAQVVDDSSATCANHSTKLSALDLPAKTFTVFSEELKRVEDAIASGSAYILPLLPGKHLLSILVGVLGFSNVLELTNLVVRSLNRQHLKRDDPLFALGEKVEKALLTYLPPRKA